LPAWEIKGFGGMVPLVDPRLLNDNMAEASVNCDLTSGQIHGLFAPVLVKDFSAIPGPVEKAYLFLGPIAEDGTYDPVWLPLPHKFTSVVRSPLANDDTNRLYYTVPGEITPFWTNYEMVKAGTPSYALGVPQIPGELVGGLYPYAPLILEITGGTTTVPEISRAYLYTWVNSIGEESAPSPPSSVRDGPPDATWTVKIPAEAIANTDRNYPPITELVLYRTVTGTDTGTQYYEVKRWDLPLTGEVIIPELPVPVFIFSDTIPDTEIVGNLTLPSVGWENPPDYLDGLTSLPGGMLVGWTGNTVHFCEPDRPHTWPGVYDQSLHYNIVALAVWQQYLLCLTTGYPSTGSGNSPPNFIFSQSQVPEPCVSRGSVIVDLTAAYYASQNGLVQISGYGMNNITMQLVDKEKWQENYNAANIVACRHRSQYLAIIPGDKAFLLDQSDPRVAFEDLTTFKGATSIWNDEYYGDTYICADKKIYRWDDTGQARLRYRWRSKRFFAPVPISLGAVQVTLGPEVEREHTGQFSPPPLDNGDPSLALPDGAWGVFRYYAGPDFTLIMEHTLFKQQDIFRLPKGFRAFDHQIEIVSMASVYSVQLGTTMTELRGV
jgi:hypothetical protein